MVDVTEVGEEDLATIDPSVREPGERERRSSRTHDPETPSADSRARNRDRVESETVRRGREAGEEGDRDPQGWLAVGCDGRIRSDGFRRERDGAGLSTRRILSE